MLSIFFYSDVISQLVIDRLMINISDIKNILGGEATCKQHP